ncbi:MAG TPA: Spy/CpxP family protein refolding chaperone [Burkholderiales bacterium]|jgi:Skp family chaperone for outer membrane proteins
MNRLIGATLFSAALAAASVSAVAQGHDERQPRPFSRPTDQVEARLAYIRTALKITDAQQPQWNAYADRLRAEASERDKKMHERHEKMMQMRKEMAQGRHEHRRPSAIERMERAQQMHAAAIARINGRLAVEKPLYAALSPEQKQVADVVLAPHGGRHGGFERGMGRGKPAGRA